jgi:hypothetical protein
METFIKLFGSLLALVYHCLARPPRLLWAGSFSDTGHLRGSKPVLKSKSAQGSVTTQFSRSEEASCGNAAAQNDAESIKTRGASVRHGIADLLN